MEEIIKQTEEFISYVVKNLVTEPDNVKIEIKSDSLGILVELEVSKEDMGRIIGKEGRTVDAIRTLLKVLGSKTNSRINLKIIDKEKEQE